MDLNTTQFSIDQFSKLELYFNEIFNWTYSDLVCFCFFYESHDKKNQPGEEERIYFILLATACHWGMPGQGLEQKPQRNAASWLAPWLILNQLSDAAQALISRNAVAPPHQPSIKAIPHTATGQSDRGNSSLELSSSQLALDCVNRITNLTKEDRYIHTV